jgi:hypothetical protein
MGVCNDGGGGNHCVLPRNTEYLVTPPSRHRAHGYTCGADGGIEDSLQANGQHIPHQTQQRTMMKNPQSSGDIDMILTVLHLVYVLVLV